MTTSTQSPGNFDWRLAVLLTLLVYAVISLLCGCSRKYTESQARQMFGCKTDSVHQDSIMTIRVDTFWRDSLIPADTVYKAGPCEELAKMKPGEKKVIKGKRSSLEYGKDSTGTTYVKCMADEYRMRMMQIREWWHSSVRKIVFQSNPAVELTRWQKIRTGLKTAMEYWGYISLVIFLLMLWKKGN